MEIDAFIRFVVIFFAVALFLVATYLYLSKNTGPASSAMGFVFLMVVVLTISNYKRIKGFGFEAEMWDEKQAQAAKLIDRLELLSKASTQQLVQIAAKLGCGIVAFLILNSPICLILPARFWKRRALAMPKAKIFLRRSIDELL